MAKIQDTKITLRFHGDDLDPQELSNLLGAMPTSAAAKGATLRSESGRERMARTGQWHLRVEATAPDEEFDSQVTRLLDHLTSDLDTWRDLSGRFDGNLFVGFFLGSSNEGVVIDPETLGAIAARGLELGFDIYGQSDD
jgi:hypothetical protein